MKKKISCLFAVILCVGCFASTAAFADEVRQTPSEFAKEVVNDYIEYVCLGISNNVGEHFSDMMSGADFEKMVAAAKKDGDAFIKHQTEKSDGHTDYTYENRTAEEVVTTFPVFMRKWMSVERYKHFGEYEKFSYTIWERDEVKGSDGLIYVTLETSRSYNYTDDSDDGGAGGKFWYYIVLFDTGSEYYVCDIGDSRFLGDLRFNTDDIAAEVIAYETDKSSSDIEWPIRGRSKITQTDSENNNVESEPTESEPTEPAQEKGTGEDAPLPTAALVAVIGTAVIICLIIALFAVLSRREKK